MGALGQVIGAARWKKLFGNKWRARLNIKYHSDGILWFNREELLALYEVIGAMLFGDLCEVKEARDCDCLVYRFADGKVEGPV